MFLDILCQLSLKARTVHLGSMGDTYIFCCKQVGCLVRCSQLGCMYSQRISVDLGNKLVAVQHESLASGLVRDTSWEGSQLLTDTDPLADSLHPFNSFLACIDLPLTIPLK